MVKPKIHTLFQNALRPLTSDEYKSLETHIMRQGFIMDPIRIWKGKNFIVDGHHRFTIAEENELPYETIEIAFKDEKEAIAWIQEHHATRRNQSADILLFQMGCVHKHWTDVAKALAKEEDLSEQAALSEVAPTKQVEEMFGVSANTAKRAARHAANVEKLSTAIQEKYIGGELIASTQDIAKLAELPKGQQQKALNMVNTSEVKNITQAVSKLNPKKKPSGGAEAIPGKAAMSKKQLALGDPKVEKTFEAFKRMMAAMPNQLYVIIRPHCEAIFEEFKRRQQEV